MSVRATPGFSFFSLLQRSDEAQKKYSTEEAFFTLQNKKLIILCKNLKHILCYIGQVMI